MSALTGLIGVGFLVAAAVVYPENLEPDRAAPRGGVALLSSQAEGSATVSLSVALSGQGQAHVTMQVISSTGGEWFAVVSGSMRPVDSENEVRLAAKLPWLAVNDSSVHEYDSADLDGATVIQLDRMASTGEDGSPEWSAEWDTRVPVLTKIGRGVRVASKPQLSTGSELHLSRVQSKRLATSGVEWWKDVADKLLATSDLGAPAASLSVAGGAFGGVQSGEVRSSTPVTAAVPVYALHGNRPTRATELHSPLLQGEVALELPPGVQLVSAQGDPQVESSRLEWPANYSSSPAFVVTQVPAEVARADEGLFRAGLFLGFGITACSAALSALLASVRDRPVRRRI